jgi:hypothetical protein
MRHVTRDLTMDELDTVSGGDIGDMSQMDSMKLQMLMDRWSKAEQSLSNLMKRTGDTRSQIVGNLK